ncbi:MAG: hypothetical protein A3A83_04200 [Candidatus Doudnabacteria bacterium RIFCSPLOWO2_01_FULL_48_57]|nr:MAG: hypothetical protein A3K05_02945 [Candidatus Doudnabacteria bacterium RIFCSPHIGHO2_01_48_18]OGE91911.1 MAG: hypothetical protein A3F44_03870 [Candidatus Doudnabacteria bacterium RIFCSPHIGHO2_12_FULL_47_25]OGE97752.1 MAG: hypothetical protein A3A83_04200 [Candidatus Doudnabacteria bacterium RIFCSPLOWO2_01_FULL_48_57]OGF02193.1 MAG: hypothetical protein A3G07_02350 [Candidatus Doudnabacteria bacterium RIFCSPLOWO2_12_FULL_47_12]
MRSRVPFKVGSREVYNYRHQKFSIMAKRSFIKILAIWSFLSTAAVTVFASQDRIVSAGLKMAWGLIVLWVGAGGYIMHRFRDSIKNFVQRIPLGWKKKFVLFATLLFLIKEAIITTMTNLAPVFGASIGEVYITASANFLDVVFFHSATMFVGPFVFWALALRRYDFSPFGAFIVFGLTGLLGEIGFSAHSRCRSLPCGCLYMAL